jgi:hypothetical protein
MMTAPASRNFWRQMNPQRDRSRQRERTRRGHHPIVSIDIVLDEHGIPVVVPALVQPYARCRAAAMANASGFVSMTALMPDRSCQFQPCGRDTFASGIGPYIFPTSFQFAGR